MKTPNRPDFEETVLETFHEMETEAQITTILAELPDDVVQAIEDYEITHPVDRDRLLELATIAVAERTDLLSDACAQLIDTPESFTWPIKDPLLCMEIAFLREHAFRWAHKVCVKYWTP
jgi:hypothetical protein